MTTSPNQSGHSSDPTEESRWRRLHMLLKAMDDEIARVYDEQGVGEVKPRFAMPLIRLGRHGAMTIRQLAESVGVTHSAMSQTVDAMRRAGLVYRVAGADARTRQVALTERAEQVASFAEAEWRATEAALADLEAETPHPMSRVVADLEAALARRSFHDRIAGHLARDLPA